MSKKQAMGTVVPATEEFVIGTDEMVDFCSKLIEANVPYSIREVDEAEQTVTFELHVPEEREAVREYDKIFADYQEEEDQD